MFESAEGLGARHFEATPSRSSCPLASYGRTRSSWIAATIFLLIPAWYAWGAALDAQPAGADQVLLNNGDHFTGKIVNKTAETVMLSTDYAGMITIHQNAIKTIIPAPEPVVSAAAPVATPQQTKGCPSGSSFVPASWQLVFQGAPDKVVLGTQSQEQFGGEAGLNFCEGSPRDATSLFAKGSHTRTYKELSTSIQTDVAGAQLEQQHFFKSVQGAGIFEVVEEFTNNSLGMAAERSAGIGLDSPQFHQGRFYYDFSVEGRYVGEHLDHTAAHLNLAAVRIGEQTHTQGTFSWNEQAWIMPTLNDIHGLQGYATAGPSISIKKWLKLGLTEEESYLGNAPKPNRKNYFASTLSLTIQGGSGVGSK